MHLKRLLSAAVLLPAALAIILWSPPPAFAAVICLVALGGAAELYGLAAAAGIRPVWPTGLLGALLLPAAAHLGGMPAALAGLAVAGAGTLAWLALSGADPAPAALRAGVTVLGATYVGGLLAFLLLLRQMPSGPARVVTAAAIAWAGEVGAFYAGRAAGRRPRAPAVSPGKTREGAAAGLLASAVAGAIGAAVWAGPLPAWAGAGALIGLAGQAGDLAESLIKRSLGAKDSGRLIPGHGGLLDRIDSLLFAAPALYGLLRLGLIP